MNYRQLLFTVCKKKESRPVEPPLLRNLPLAKKVKQELGRDYEVVEVKIEYGDVVR